MRVNESVPQQLDNSTTVEPLVLAQLHKARRATTASALRTTGEVFLVASDPIAPTSPISRPICVRINPWTHSQLLRTRA